MLSGMLEGPTSYISDLTLLPMEWLVSSSYDWSVMVWTVDIAAPRAVWTFVATARIPTCIGCDGNLIAAGDSNRRIHLLNVED